MPRTQKGERNMEKQRKGYESAEVEIVLFEFSDIVTLSAPEPSGGKGDGLDFGNVDSGEWI